MTTESDRELLELAAKAAGYVLDYTIRPDGKAFYHSDRNALAIADGGWFAPLTDDGDALRLAVKLNIRFAGEWGGKCVALVGVREFAEESGSDADAATRRAITRAAASIGRGEG